MNAEEVLKSFRSKFGASLKNGSLQKREITARESHSLTRVWFSIETRLLRNAVKHLCSIHGDPHFAVIAGHDLGKEIEMIYIFTLGYGSPHEEFTVSMKVRVPKTNPVVPSITDIIPGALISEREMQEMLGVKVRGIPDGRRLFLDKDFPKGVFPWRKDEKGPGKLVRNLHESEVL